MSIILSVILVEFLLIQSSLSANNASTTQDWPQTRTVNEPNGVRFQRILHRKKRLNILFL